MLDRNRALEEENEALKAEITRKDAENQGNVSELRLAKAKVELLQGENHSKEQEIAHLHLNVTGLGQEEDFPRLELEQELRTAKAAVAKYQKELKLLTSQTEDASLLCQKREEQLRTLIKRIKSLEGETAYWKEEARKKAGRVIDLERRLKDQSSPVQEEKKQESLEKRLQRALKQLEEKRTELELLKSMVKRVSPQRKQEISPDLQHQKSQVSPGLLPKVHNSPTPVPAAKQWPREAPNYASSKSFISPAHFTRPLQPEPAYFGVYSPPLEAIHKRVMNYTPSELKLPPVEAEELVKEESRSSQGSELAREDLA